MAKLYANGGDPDQTSQNAASDLGLHCLPINLSGVSGLIAECYCTCTILLDLPCS